jgi:hypothetical protein
VNTITCRNRHCPKCQTNKRDQWLEKQKHDLLPVPYFHIVFTLPHDLSSLVLQNRQLLYGLLLRSSAQTLLEVAADPAHLGAQIGFLSVLHTWGQNLLHHPHVHCVVPAGGLAPDGSRWVHTRPGFFLPIRVLSKIFRGKFTAALKNLYRRNKLPFHGSLKMLAEPRVFAKFLRQLFRQDWVVYAKRPFGGPEHVLHYLARYTHRVAISNHRLLAFEHDRVTFRWKDYAHGNKRRKNDSHHGRVPPALLASFASTRFHAYSSFRNIGEPLPRATDRSLPASADGNSAATLTYSAASSATSHMGLSSLRRANDRHRMAWPSADSATIC